MQPPATGPLYTYVQTVNQVLRLLPIRVSTFYNANDLHHR
jgi:hypothetical protein